MKMTELTRMLKCFTAKSYHSLQDDYSRISLIREGDSSGIESVLDTNGSLDGEEESLSEVEIEANAKLRVRPRSAGDITETLIGSHREVVIVGGSLTPSESTLSGTTFVAPFIGCNRHNNSSSSNNNQHNQNNNSNNNSSGGGNGVGGGILSFFGVRFNKSGTRHLDRGTTGLVQPSDSSLDKGIGKSLAVEGSGSGDHRYTKFPLTSPSHLSISNQHTFPPSSLLQSPSSPNSEATHIHLTPHHQQQGNKLSSAGVGGKSPVPTVKGLIQSASPNKLLAQAVSSLGRKARDSVNQNQQDSGKSSSRSKQHLKVKSKSDNSLHRVTLSGGSSSSTNRNNQTSAPRHGRNVLSPDSYPQGEQRLNSVQLGDHATIRLPWTGFQPQPLNNLSSVTKPKTHRNTHNNQLFENEDERYVECGGDWGGTHSFLASSRSAWKSSGGEKIVGRRRARSLERAHNFRIFPVVHSLSSSSQGNNSKSDFKTDPVLKSPPNSIKSSTTPNSHQQQHQRSCRESNSLERPARNRIRQTLSPEEQEILRRNLSLVNPVLPPKTKSSSRPSHLHTSNNPQPLSDLPPALPKKKAKPPPLGKLHRSAPNSSFSSVESSSSSSCSADSVSASAPPSPPPRPASSLKPENRLISTSQSSSCIATEKNTKGLFPESRPPPPTPQKLLTSNSKSSSNNSLASSNNNSSLVNMETNRRQHQPSARIDNHHSNNDSETPSFSIGTAVGGLQHHHDDGRTTSSFINKPSKGWLHPDTQLAKEGVIYTVRYIGCLDVNTSMKNLDYDTRSLIAKECINQVCEAAGMKSIDKKRKIDRRVGKILGLRPRLDQAGSDVHLTITSTCLKLTSLDNGAVIASHDLPNISFASGGDPTMLDFVAYVAKDAIVGRACFVLECGSGRAQDVITTVGQAFELRFKEYLQKRPAAPAAAPLRLPTMEDPDRDYYNDLPGKLPPEGEKTGGASGSSESREAVGKSAPRVREGPNLTLPVSGDNKDVMSVNLIDFEAPTPPAFGPTTNGRNLEALLMGSSAGPSPVSSPTVFTGTSMIPDSQANVGSSGLISPAQNKDLFNMQPFDDVIPNVVSSGAPLGPEEQKAELEGEPWYHGIISRAEAEALVRNDGDFLVRESQASPGQYVLTGLQNGSCKHLLLVDPEGVVRTKDKEFDSVSHLIRYHSDNCLPIISSESMVLLQTPVYRQN